MKKIKIRNLKVMMGVKIMKKKTLLTTLVMLSLLQGGVYAANEPVEVDDKYYAMTGNGETTTIDKEFFKQHKDIEQIIGAGWIEDEDASFPFEGDKYAGDIHNTSLAINAGNDNKPLYVCGSYTANGNVYNNKLNITAGEYANVEGVFLDNLRNSINSTMIKYDVYSNTVKFTGANLNGYCKGTSLLFGNAYDNKLYLRDIKFLKYIPGVVTGVVGVQNDKGDIYDNYLEVKNSGIVGYPVGYIYGGNTFCGDVKDNEVKIINSKADMVHGGISEGYGYNSALEEIDPNKDYSDYLKESIVSGNKVTLIDSKVGNVFGGYALYDRNSSHNAGKAIANKVILSGKSEAALVFGGMSSNNDVIDNKIILEGESKVTSIVVAGVAESEIKPEFKDEIARDVELRDNSITLKDKVNVENAALYGAGITDEYGNITKAKNTSGNKLVIDGWSGKVNSINNFEVFSFNNLDFKSNETLVNAQTGSNLGNAKVEITSIANAQDVKVGDKVGLIKIVTEDNFNTLQDGYSDTVTTGVATDITADIEKDNDNQILNAVISGVERNAQTDLVAESRAVAAAFVNQGIDLITDSLDTLSRDGKYGVKTFAGVHGNRSKYDVNSDIKINGWSTIVGVGSENEHNGGDFSWGVFYENGSGNYRTYNEFNNEFFRGDGSLVYNGGGIAARYENSHGVYTEGSLRAGMLKSDMDKALRDASGAEYGYESESTYYGAHIGVGQVIPLTESTDLDVYGKFFHTYTEGDSFNVAGDEFEFDSINSDRLRVGARLTTNKENKFSIYYGLAYEYEFNGDAEMRAAGMSAPTQSLQGSSYMAEIGFNYQPTPDSPWSFDLNLRGYAGEREGGTFNVQATYTF